MCNADAIFAKLSKSKYFTKIDLSKGYWQISVKNSCRHYTAFITPHGLFQYRKMAFGLVNSGATFCRRLDHVENFVDDILVHTETWQQHLLALQRMFERLSQMCITAKPSKCFVGFPQLDFVGHVVGDGCLQPNPKKLEKIQNCPRPETKNRCVLFLVRLGTIGSLSRTSALSLCL